MGSTPTGSLLFFVDFIMGCSIDYTTPQGKLFGELRSISFKATPGGLPKLIFLEIYRRPDGTPGYPSDQKKEKS